MFAEHHRQSDGGMKNRVHKSSFFHQMHALLGIEPAPQPALIRHIYHSDSQNFPPYHSSLSASPLEQTPTVEMPASMGHSNESFRMTVSVKLNYSSLAKINGVR